MKIFKLIFNEFQAKRPLLLKGGACFALKIKIL